MPDTDTWSQVSVVSTVTHIWAGQFRVRVQVGANDLSLLQNLQPGSGVNPPSNGYGTEGLSCGVNQQRFKINHLLLSGFEVNSEWGYKVTPAVCLHGVNSNKFTFAQLYSNHKEPCRK